MKNLPTSRASSFILTSSLSVFLSCVASGATYSVGNDTGEDANGIADSDGNSFRGNGVVAIGSFSNTSFNTFTAADFLSNFTQFDVGSETAFTTSPIFNFQGSFDLDTGNEAVTASAFENETIYLFVGNGSTFANSDEFLVLDLQRDFLAADDSAVGSIDILVTDTSATLAFGTNDPNVQTDDPDTTVTPGWRTATPIPEPSVALLGGLGVLSLLRRRR